MNNQTEVIDFYEKESTILISQILGYIGGALVVSLNIPQLILIIKTKNVSNYSKETIILNIVIGFVYTSYGVLINQWPVIISNILYLIISFLLIHFKYKYDTETSSINKDNQTKQTEQISQIEQTKHTE